jgi:microcystin-dependent protein
MSDQFVAEIRIFPFNFAPTGWATCDGQTMPISQNTALFSLLGTTYGGDGKSTFALPDLRGSAPMQPGQGSGLSLRDLGQIGGSDSVTLLTTEIPVHTHTAQVSNATATLAAPAGNVPARIAYSTGTQSGTGVAYSANTPTVQMAPQALSIAGGSQPHNNLQPYLTLTFCIALQGIFPQRP